MSVSSSVIGHNYGSYSYGSEDRMIGWSQHAGCSEEGSVYHTVSTAYVFISECFFINVVQIRSDDYVRIALVSSPS